MREWTAQQRQVIKSGADRLLCAAAAGSGKTAVLVERIVRMIREGAEPDSFLVITFTNAAAAEMREKIRIRLREEQDHPRLKRALNLIGCMEICTIHSFCQDVIRQEFTVVHADPFFRVCPAPERRILFDEAFRAACNWLNREEDTDWLIYKERFSRTQTEEIVRTVYTFMMSLPDPLRWLERATEDVPRNLDGDHPWAEILRRMIREKMDTAALYLNRMFRMFGEYGSVEAYRDVWKADAELFHVKQSWAEGKIMDASVLAAPMQRMPAVRKGTDYEEDWKERYKQARESLKKLNGEINSLILQDGDEVEAEFSNIRGSLLGLRKIVMLTAQSFTDRKRRKGLLDFMDLEHEALRILRDERSRQNLQERYRNIFVDECQDISGVQSELIDHIVGEESSLFLVGDVKQSIYRFRQANPMIFLDREREFADRQQNGETRYACIRLNRNFRSAAPVLETTNIVFRDVMREEAAELDYTPEEELVPGLKDPEGPPVMIDLVDHSDGEDSDAAAVADRITARITEMVSAGEFAYRDMVILMPVVNPDGKILSRLLEERGVPVYFDGDGSYYEQPEVLVFLNLLKALDNRYRDLPLITALKGVPFLFTDEELAAVRLCAPGKDVPFHRAFDAACAKEDRLGERCREARETLADWRFLTRIWPVEKLVRYLSGRSMQMAMAGAGLHGGETAKHNLRLMCAHAREAEESGIRTLHGFLAYVEGQAGNSDRKSAVTLGEKDNVVRIMTMHKSKGLQFPVVFLAGLDKQVDGAGGGAAETDEALGICVRYKNPDRRIARRTAADQIFDWKKGRETRAEKMRLLYVAMTRAQRKLFLISCRTDRPLWHLPPGNARILGAKTYIDWVMPALLDWEKSQLSTNNPQASKPWITTVLDSNQQRTVENEDPVHRSLEWLDGLLSETPVEEMWKKKSQTEDTGEPVKSSVTRLVRKAREETGILTPGEPDEETPEQKRIPEEVARALRRLQSGPLPAFMEESEPERSGVYHGTVVHRFLSIAELEKLRGAEDPLPPLRDMVREMAARDQLSPREAEEIDPAEAAGWFASPLGKRMLASPVVRREWNFNLYRGDCRMILQGVVDCAFLEGDAWVVVDYKTDRITAEKAFVEEYTPQLNWYAQALEQLSGRKVKECWLYSLTRQKAYPVAAEPL